MNNFTKLIVFLAVSSISATGMAQDLNCNSFLKGNYVQIGVNWNGAYGSSATPPSGYNADTLSDFYGCSGTRTALSALGFVADVDKDGWTTGTPAYYGDYILPGAHQEGWSFMADGRQINEWNSLAGDSSALEGGMTIYDTSYTSGPSGDTSRWEGSYNDQFFILQRTVLDPGKLFFTVLVSIVNTSTSASMNDYYMRTIKVNPGGVLSDGSYATKNKINYANPDSLNRCIVSSASNTYSKAYVALGTVNANASCFIVKNNTTPVYNTIDNISAGSDANYLYAANDSNNNASGIGIIFSLGSIGSGAEVDFSFVYAFSPAALEDGLGVTIDTTLGPDAVAQVKAPECKLYPNPASNNFTISGLANTDKVVLYDELGRDMTQSITVSGKNSFSLTDAIAPGVYMVIVKGNDGAIKWATHLQKQ